VESGLLGEALLQVGGQWACSLVTVRRRVVGSAPGPDNGSGGIGPVVRGSGGWVGTHVVYRGRRTRRCDPGGRLGHPGMTGHSNSLTGELAIVIQPSAA